MTLVRLKPADPQSRVKHSTTKPLRSRKIMTISSLNGLGKTINKNVVIINCIIQYFEADFP